MGVSTNGGTPVAGWFIGENPWKNPSKIDDDWGYPILGNPVIDAELSLSGIKTLRITLGIDHAEPKEAWPLELAMQKGQWGGSFERRHVDIVALHISTSKTSEKVEEVR